MLLKIAYRRRPKRTAPNHRTQTTTGKHTCLLGTKANASQGKIAEFKVDAINVKPPAHTQTPFF